MDNGTPTLRQRLRRIPLLGTLLAWTYSFLRLHAWRAQNNVDHAHFQSLHRILEAQLDEVRRMHRELQLRMDAAEARDEAMLRDFDARITATQAQAAEGQRVLHQLIAQQQESLLGVFQADMHAALERLAGLEQRLAEARQAQGQDVRQQGEALLQANAAIEMLEQRVAGLSQAIRKTAGAQD